MAGGHLLDSPDGDRFISAEFQVLLPSALSAVRMLCPRHGCARDVCIALLSPPAAPWAPSDVCSQSAALRGHPSQALGSAPSTLPSWSLGDSSSPSSAPHTCRPLGARPVAQAVLLETSSALGCDCFQGGVPLCTLRARRCPLQLLCVRGVRLV